VEVVELKKEYLKRLESLDDKETIWLITDKGFNHVDFGLKVLKNLFQWRKQDENFRTKELSIKSHLEKQLMSKVLAELSKPYIVAREAEDTYSLVIQYWRSESKDFRDKEAVVLNENFKLLEDKYLTALKESDTSYVYLDEIGIRDYELKWWVENIDSFNEERIFIMQIKFLARIAQGYEVQEACRRIRLSESSYLNWLHKDDFRNRMADLYYSPEVKKWRKLRRLADKESEVWTRIKNFVDSEVADIYDDLE